MTEPRDRWPDQPDERDAPWTPPAPEHTQPVDVSHTQALPPAPMGEPAPGAPGAQVRRAARQARGTPLSRRRGPMTRSRLRSPAPGTRSGSTTRTRTVRGATRAGRATTRAGSRARAWGQEQGWNQGQDWTQAHHATTQGDTGHRGPGWAALIGVAAASALLAGLLGGVAGGWLGSSDRLGFGGFDRSPSSLPTVGSGATSRPDGSIANIAAKALPSVVTIKVQGADGNGTGSGFVADEQGHIITNNHVVAGAADEGTIRVQLSNGREISATIAGRDSSYDLAVLKTGRSDLQPLAMGSSADVVVGDQVIAVGAPLGLDSTVTSGIVSALNRPVSPGGDGDEQSFINAIQTDAAINPGNSGGPLLDMEGHVIGVNSAIARVPGTSGEQSGSIGVGFSIPSDQVRKTAEQLIRTGKAEHPIIGVILDRQYDGADGVKILESSTANRQPVSPEGPAGKAGVEPGDLILEFDGRRVTDPDDLVVAIRAKSVGDEVTMKVRRDSREISVRMVLQGTTDE